MFAEILSLNQTQTNNPITTPTPMPIVGGWVGEQLNNTENWVDLKIEEITDGIAQGIYNGFLSIMSTIGEMAFWTAKIGIVCCMLVYFVSEDKKAVSLGMKLLFIYLILGLLLSKVGV